MMERYPTGDRRLPHHMFPPKVLTSDQLTKLTGVIQYKVSALIVKIIGFDCGLLGRFPLRSKKCRIVPAEKDKKPTASKKKHIFRDVPFCVTYPKNNVSLPLKTTRNGF